MPSAPVPESDIQALMEAVDRADQAGNRTEAERALARARELAPDHPGVLDVAGMRALAQGDAHTARALLERAASLAPSSPFLWVHVALTRRDSGDQPGERDALEQALAIDPRYFPALLHKARLFERQGKRKAAAQMYQAFLCCLPPGVPAPPAVQEAIGHANEVLRQNDVELERFLQPRLRETRARHEGARLERFDACLEAVIGKRRVFMPQPTFLLVPRVPPIEFIDREHYPWLESFDAAAPEIREEALRALSQANGDFVPYISMPPGAPVDQWRELNNSRRWSTFFLIRNGKRLDDPLALCPRTAALLESAPLCEVPGHAPTAFFSVLAPRTRIPPHTGVTNARLIVHLPLVVPPGCSYRVGAERREWREGKAWVFDDTFEHEALNDGDTPRILLIFDVWNCFLDPAERDLLAALIAGVQEYNEGESPFRQGG